MLNQGQIIDFEKKISISSLVNDKYKFCFNICLNILFTNKIIIKFVNIYYIIWILFKKNSFINSAILISAFLYTEPAKFCDLLKYYK